MGAKLQLDYRALQHNLSRVRALAPKARVMAVIKANGYGHGMVEVANALQESDAFAIANLDEAIALREAGIHKDLVVLEGIQNREELEEASRHNISLVVHHKFQLELLDSATLDKPVQVWLKIDTGMHRLGFPIDQAESVWHRLQACESVQVVRIMSHFANADDPQHPSTEQQLNRFLKLVKSMDTECSIANSAGLCQWKSSHLDWVRPGIMLYGANPFTTGTRQELDLKPVMTLSSQLIAINQLRKGDAIGYGSSWVCPEDMTVGVAAIGYGDGYPRHAPSGTPVLLNGKRVNLVGRVSMDMICLDLRKQPDATIGDEIILWGEGLPVEEVARMAGTISYELLCKITNRVKRISV